MLRMATTGGSNDGRVSSCQREGNERMKERVQEGYCDIASWRWEFSAKPIWHFRSFLGKAAETAVCTSERRNVECFETEKPVAASQESTEEQNTLLHAGFRNGMKSTACTKFRLYRIVRRKDLLQRY